MRNNEDIKVWEKNVATIKPSASSQMTLLEAIAHCSNPSSSEHIEAYKDPIMLKPPNDIYWDDDELFKWCNGVRYTVRFIMMKLGLKDDDSAYYLAKNLWYFGCDEEEIEYQLAKYAHSKS